MGVAEVIPGVSGGTIAFITGIYERLLNVIKAIDPSLLKSWKADGVRGVWKAIDGNFVSALISGMFVGIVIGVFLITYLMETYPLLVWSYFFGLILVSALFVAKQIKTWKFNGLAALIFGAAIAYYITISVPGVGNPALYYVFFSGSIAVSALLLPGISGSFILLLMGMYTYVIPTVKSALKTFDPSQIMVLLVFGSGMLFGMLVFARVLSWTFKHYHDLTLAVLTGFLLGSLNKIWPWQAVIDTMEKDDGAITVTFSKSVLPGHFASLADNPVYGNDPQLIGCIILMVLGFFTVFGAELISNKLSKS